MKTPSGYVEWHGSKETGRWRTRITRPDPTPEDPKRMTREWVPLPAELRHGDRAKARRVALHMQLAGQSAARITPADATEGESVEDYITRWVADRRKRGLSNADQDEQNLKRYLVPPLGPRSMASITPHDLARIVRGLDDKVAAEELEWKTATNIWGLVRKMFRDAAKSKRHELRILATSPATDVEGPDRGKAKAKQFLWPSELLTLAECPDVPLAWRRICVVAVYLGLRAGEINALRVEDIDRVRWVVNITETVSTRKRTSTRRKAPKTQAGIRSFAVEPAARPLLDALCRERGGGPLFDRFRTDGPDGAAPRLREYLAAAKVTRAELHATTRTRKNITFHDLRATYATWCAVRGDEPMKIMRRAGHEDLKTTMGYVRAAEVLDKELVGEVFPALPLALVRPLDMDHQKDPAALLASKTLAAQRVGERPQRDSKPLPAPHGAAAPHESGDLASSEGRDAGARGAPSSPRGTLPGTSADAMRDAVQRAVAEGDFALAQQLLALLQPRVPSVIDLEAERRRRTGG